MKAEHLKSIIAAIHNDSEVVVEFESTPSLLTSVIITGDFEDGVSSEARIGGELNPITLDDACLMITNNEKNIVNVY